MFILGLQGSPRRKSNTVFLLSSFMAEAKKRGAETHTFEVCRKNIVPCKEIVVCETKGYCPIDDDMKHEVYPLLRRADVVVAATPIFFYNGTAQLKALIDRSQTLWARKYRLKLKDPGSRMRKGFVLSVAATRGKTLFDGLDLTAKYFFDAIDADYEGSLTYRGVEHRGDLEKHPTVRQDVENAVDNILTPFMGRKKVLFASRKNACLSQMASAFTGHLAGDRIEALCGGTEPVEKLDPLVADVMAEQGVDMAFRRPMSLETALAESRPDLIVTLGEGVDLGGVSGAEVVSWQLPDTSGEQMEDMRRVRDELKARVVEFIDG